MTTPTDPTTLRTALEALVGLVDCYGLDHYGGDWGCAECHPDSDMLVAGFQCGLHLARAVLATPAPAADEALPECEFPEPCCYRNHEWGEDCTLPPVKVIFTETLDPAPPTPPATERCAECAGQGLICLAGCPPPMDDRCPRCHGTGTPPATEPSAALVSELVGDLRLSELGRDGRLDIVARKLDAIVVAARAEGLDGLTVAMVADAIHPEGQGPTIDCCMGSTVESLYPPDEAARLHRKHHEEAATRFLAYLAARARRAVEERA